MTAYLEAWVDHAAEECEILTPRDARARGAQLSLLFKHDSVEAFEQLQRAGVVADYRRPDVIRVAPAPLYNSFYDVWRFGQALGRLS